MPKKRKEESSSDEDSDVGRNFTLFTERGGAGGGGAGGGGGGGGGGAGDTDSDEDDVEENPEESSEASEEEEEEDEESGDVAGSSEVQTAEDVKRELSSMSFEDVLTLQKQVGTKVYSQVAHGSRKTAGSSKKRLNKNRPSEVSSKRPAPFLRQVTSVRKPTQRDPRFDDLSGEYKAEIFDKTYKFIDDIKSREKQMIQKQLSRTKNNQKKEKLQFLLKRMENQEREKRSREQQRERDLHFKRQQRERVAQGASPFFINTAEKKKLHLAEKYQELKKSGKLETFLSKKRKRNAGKDRRNLPRGSAPS